MPTAKSFAELTGQRIKCSVINKTEGVITTCRKSDGGKVIDQILNKAKLLSDGQGPSEPARNFHSR